MMRRRVLPSLLLLGAWTSTRPAGASVYKKESSNKIFNIIADDEYYPSLRNKRDTSDSSENSVAQNIQKETSNLTTVFDLQDSHLHLMVHWAGRGSSIVFCLARDQAMNENSTSRFFVSTDYGTSFQDVSSRFLLESGENATLNKFFYHPNNHCYYVFTDILHKRIFVSQDCGATVSSSQLTFTPSHIEFDENTEPRFVIHERGISSNYSLYVTENFGETFTNIGTNINNFFIHYTEAETVLYTSRMEPSGDHTILASTDFFKNIKNRKVVFTGAAEFDLKEGYLFAVKNSSDNNNKMLYVGRHDQKMTVARFPENDLKFLAFHVVEVTEEGSIMVVASHNATYSNLYVSDIVSEHQVQFSLSLERIMFYAPHSTWRNSWIASLSEGTRFSEAVFADFYAVEGLRGIYIASQLSPGVTEDNITPNNLTTLITFDAGGKWSRVEGPSTDHLGHTILGCYQDRNCSLHIAQQMSKKYPATRSIPVLTSPAAPGVVLATGNMDKNLKTKTNVFMSLDAGLSWRQVLQGNYYYNIGDHGGVLVAVKYFKTEGYTNELLYSTDEGLNWKTHQFYPTPMRIFGLITEPGENTTVFTMFGTKGNPGQPIDWIMIKIDLMSVFQRNCTDGDYKDWSPKAPEEGKLSKCVMGRRDVFRRRSPKADCYNGDDFTHAKRVENCPCTHSDYRCDFGFVRSSDIGSSCISDPRFDLETHAAPSVCPPNTFYDLTKGYVKVAGDTCEDGHASRFEPETRACPYDIDGRETFMLIAQRKKVVKLSLEKANSPLEVLPLVDVQNVIAMDMDYESECVFWADMDKDTVNKQCLSNSSRVEVLVSSNLRSVEGMAFDHISKILYFVDGFRKTIELVKTNAPSREHSMRKIILSSTQLGTTSKPRGIAVHPKQGYLYYTDWAEKAACVGRSLLDGSNHSIIVNSLNAKNQIQVKWPNGISIDSVAERVYWVDAALDFIASVNLDGDDFKKIVFHTPEVSHPFAVFVFKQSIYWDDWTRKSIYSANKNDGSDIRVVQKDISGAMDLKIYSPHLLSERNSCSDHKCSHLCIALPPGSPQPYRCLCPDGMKANGSGSLTECVCPDNQLLLQNGTCSAAQVGGLCDTEVQFQCANKLCVPKLWKCDGSNDCGDMSDESDCYQENCPDGKFQCADKKCIPAHWKCDSEKDCMDGSDEDDCPRQICDLNTQFECSNGQCINNKWRCDGEKDCYDGTDETNCTSGTLSCKPDQMQCSVGGSCLPAAWLCDGDDDCPGGSDELNCTESATCQPWQFRCDNNHCIFNTWHCDGHPDCMDGSDEKECDNINNNKTKIPVPAPHFPSGECNDWMFKCGSEQCIPFWWKCDQVADCSDGSDELGCNDDDKNIDPADKSNKTVSPEVLGCADNKFECYDGKCIYSAWLCDGDSDCLKGEDEDPEMCRDKVRCAPGQFMCKNSPGCVSLTSICNGRNECADGSDEDGCETKEADGGDAATHCDESQFMCDLGSVCLSWESKCDGHLDCRDGSDEDHCDLWNDDMAIRSLEVGAVTDHSATVRWWPKPALAKTSLQYKLSYTVYEHSHWINKTQDWEKYDNWETVVDGLQPGTHYKIRLFVKDSAKEYHHAPVVNATTLDGVPTPPRQLAIQQMGSAVILTWKPPQDPRGTLDHYKVTVKSGDNVVNGAKVPVKDPTVDAEAGFGGLKPGAEYTFQVFAWNKASRSEGSEPLTFVLHNDVQDLKVVNSSSTTISLSWRKLETLADYNVMYQSGNQLDFGTNVNITKNEVTLIGLAPATDYTIYVSGITGHGLTLPTIVKTKTSGSQLPTPVILDEGTGRPPRSPTSVKISWRVETGGVDYTYGVWYGTSLRELVSEGPRARFTGSFGTVSGLAACTDYIFAVAIISGNNTSGIGPMSNRKTVSTKYSPTAAVKEVKVVENRLTWRAPCDTLESPLSYLIRLRNQVDGKSVSATLAATRNQTISYSPTLKPGDVYSLTVEQVAAEEAERSAAVTMLGPPIPPPTAVFADYANRSLEVHWGQGEEAAAFEVLVTPSTDISQGCDGSECAFCMPTNKSPLTINRTDIINNFDRSEKCSKAEFKVAVSTVIMRDGVKYRSRWVPAPRLFVDMSEQHQGEIVMEESSLVGTLVGILFAVALLVTALAYYVTKHRRLRHRFQEFAASHYSSATGSAILIEDDDESPIIRGFSDNEPLVVT